MANNILGPNDMLAVAIQLAATGHRYQFDRAGRPYILHPLKVMHYTKSDESEVLAIAALHDVVEDCGITYAELRERGFSERVIDGVRCLTKIPGESEEEYKQKVKSNPDAVVVKMADLRHNSDIRRLKGVTDKDIKRTVKYHQFYLELQEWLRAN